MRASMDFSALAGFLAVAFAVGVFCGVALGYVAGAWDWWFHRRSRR